MYLFKPLNFKYDLIKIKICRYVKTIQMLKKIKIRKPILI